MRGLHIHVHRFVGNLGANHYWQCRCGRRKSTPMSGIMGPVDRDWVAGKADDLNRPDRTRPPLPRKRIVPFKPEVTDVDGSDVDGVPGSEIPLIPLGEMDKVTF